MNQNHEELTRGNEPAGPRNLLSEIAEFVGGWRGRAQHLAFFPSPPTDPTEPPADPVQAIDEGLSRAAELVNQFREEDAEAVDYYHLSDIRVCDLRYEASELLKSVEAGAPAVRGMNGFVALAEALARLVTPDHPLVVFRRVWARWQSLPSRGSDGTPLPPPNSLVDRLLTEAGAEPDPSDAGCAPLAGPGDRPPVDLAAENARLRELLAELLLETQRWTGYARRGVVPIHLLAADNAAPKA